MSQLSDQRQRAKQSSSRYWLLDPCSKQLSPQGRSPMGAVGSYSLRSKGYNIDDESIMPKRLPPAAT